VYVGWTDAAATVEQWKTKVDNDDDGSDDPIRNEITNRLVRLPFTRLHRVKRNVDWESVV
jgi:hypothetical protein